MDKDVSGRSPQNRSDAVHERTALLGTPYGRPHGHSLSVSPRTRQFGGRDEEDAEDSLDEDESNLLLARTSSISSAVGLAPEASDFAMFQHRQRKMSIATADPLSGGETSSVEYDAEAAPLLSTGKPAREYLYNTNYSLFITIFLSVMLGNFVAIFDGTIMASSHPV